MLSRDELIAVKRTRDLSVFHELCQTALYAHDLFDVSKDLNKVIYDLTNSGVLPHDNETLNRAILDFRSQIAEGGSLRANNKSGQIREWLDTATSPRYASRKGKEYEIKQSLHTLFEKCLHNELTVVKVRNMLIEAMSGLMEETNSLQITLSARDKRRSAAWQYAEAAAVISTRTGVSPALDTALRNMMDVAGKKESVTEDQRTVATNLYSAALKGET